MVNNSVTLIGHLGIDFEVKDLGNGRTLAKSRFATDDSYKDKAGNLVKQTQWHNLVVWGKRGETLAKHTKKGAQLAIHGKLIYNKYEDDQGVKRVTPQIVVSDFKFLDKKEQATPFD